MLWNQIIAVALQLLIAGISFCIGKFLLPRLPKETAAAIQDKLNLIATYATQYVNWADRFMEGAKGTEKMSAVVGILKEIAARNGFQASDQDLTAIAQTAYEKMSLEWENLEGDINAKAQEMAANMISNGGSAIRSVVDSAKNAVDQQTVSDANDALVAAISALNDAKQTIADLKNAAKEKVTDTLGYITEAVESPKQAMQDKINQLKELTTSVIEDTSDEEEYVEDPEYDVESEDEPEEQVKPVQKVMQTIASKVDPTNVAAAMKAASIPTPTSLKELAASQATQSVVNAAKGMKAVDDLAKFLK